MIRDNRQFIENLEKTNDVVRVKQEVDWDLEAGAIVRRTNEKGGPAPYFEKVRDYPSGYTIFGSPLGTYKRLATALVIHADASVAELQDEYECRTDHLIKPVIVKDAHWTNAEVKTIIVDEDVNVFDLSEVIHAFSTKCHPHNGIRTKESDYSKPLTPYLSMAERKSRKGTRVLFDCTWPEDWSRERDIPPRVSFEEIYPEETKEKVLDS